jgi:PAS domain S-box-containing protein
VFKRKLKLFPEKRGEKHRQVDMPYMATWAAWFLSLALSAAVLALATMGWAFWGMPAQERFAFEWSAYIVASLLYGACVGFAVAATRRTRDRVLLARQTRERLDLALAAGRMEFWEWDVGNGRVSVSGNARGIFGRGRSVIEDAWPQTHPDDSEHVKATIQRALESQRSYSFASRIIHARTGQIRWIETHGHVERDGAGQAIRITGVTIDVTDKHKAIEEKQQALLEKEKAFQASRLTEQRFQVALKAGSIVVWSCDSEKRYTWLYNPLVGVNTNRFIGRKIDETIPKQYPAYAEAIERVFSTAQGEQVTVTFPQRDEVRHFVSRIDPIIDDSGLVAGLIGASVDITDLQRAETAARESAEQLRMVIDSLPVLISYIDCEHRYRFNNAAYRDWFGLAREDVEGRHLRDVLGEDAYEVTRPLLERVLSGETIQEYAHMRYRLGGTRDVKITYVPHRTGATVAGAIALVEDVSMQKRLEEEIKQESRRKDEFLATLAHELRNPIAPIRYSAALLTDAASPSSVQYVRRVVERQAAHISRLLDDLLDVSRITRDVIELKREAFDLCDLVRNAIEAIRPALSNSRHQLSVSIPSQPIWICGDTTRLLQCVGNLLDNAAKYMEPGGRIEVYVERKGDSAAVRVKDTGVGLAPEMLAHVFDLFSQVHKSLRVSKGGLGIGLAVVKKLVELHGGTIEAGSDGLGRGAQFVIRLPLHANNELPVNDAVHDGNVVPLFPSHPNILVVDDNRDAAEALAALLRAQESQVTLAFDGESALQTFDSMQPSIVLLDMGLPDTDGTAVARQIRQRSRGKSVFIVAITGWGQESDRKRTREAGVDVHLVKPVDPGFLLQLLGTHLRVA